MAGPITLAGLDAQVALTNEVLMRHIEPGVRRLADVASLYGQIIPRGKRQMSGAGGQFAVGNGFDPGVSWRGTLERLPQTGEVKPRWTNFDTFNLFAAMTFEDKYLVRVANSPSNEMLLGGLKEKTKRLLDTLANEKDTAMFGDGTAVKALVTNSGSVAPANQVHAEFGNVTTIPVRFWDNNNLSFGATHFVTPGMNIAIFDSATTSLRAITRVLTTDFSTGSIIVQGHLAGVLVDGDRIVRGDSHGNDLNKSMAGIFSMFNAATGYLGVNFDVMQEWKPVVSDNGGVPRAFDAGEFLRELIALSIETPGDFKADTILVHPALSYEYWKQRNFETQYCAWETEMATKISRPVFYVNGKKLMWQEGKLMPPHAIATLNSQSWERVVDLDFQFDASLGSVLKPIQGYGGVLGAFGRGYENMICASPRENMLSIDWEVDRSLLRR